MAIFYTDSASFDNVTITQNLNVLGTSSATYTENLVIESNTIKLGNNQTLRFSGLEFVDSGSSPITSASVFFDSTNDQMIYQHNGGLTSSVFLLGPETYNDLGNETYLTQNRIPKGTGIEHLHDSNITDTGTLVSILGPLSASGGVTGAGFFGTASHAVSASYAPGGSGTTINNNTNNYVLTATGTADTINGESGLTFDGINLTVSGSVAANAVTIATTIDTTALQVNGGTATFDGDVLITTLPNDTVVANKVVVVDTITGQLYTTASVGGGASFPYDGTTIPAVITGSLLVTGSTLLGAVTTRSVLDPTNPETVYVSASNINAVHVHGSVNDFMQIEAMNMSSGVSASADFVATADNGSDFGNYIDLGINGSGYTAGFVGGASDGYLYLTSSVGELHIGHAGTTNIANVRLFAGGPNSDSTTRIFLSSSGQVGIGTLTPAATSLLHVQGNISASSVTGSLTQGGVTNITEMSMVVSGTIAAVAGNAVTLNLNNSNYFTVSASGAGTVAWTASNAPPAGRVQTFVIEYTNGGAVTNSWFTGIKWPGGAAPTLTTGTNPDILGFTTDDAGATWRGNLLQRNSS